MGVLRQSGLRFLGDSAGGDGWGAGEVRLVERLLPHVRRFIGLRQALAATDTLGAGVAGSHDRFRPLAPPARSRISHPDSNVRGSPADGPRACRAGPDHRWREMISVKPDPPWLHLLEKIWLGWREEQIFKGRDPDPHIEKKLIEDGFWRPKEVSS